MGMTRPTTSVNGSARDVSRRQKCAGWGFTAMKKPLRPGDQPMEAHGPVQITRETNNTAEKQGVIEALFWLNTCVEQGALLATDDVLITVDSLNVKELIEEKFVARENRVLASLLRHMWEVTTERIRLHIRWIRRHTGDVVNSIADRMADAGTHQELQHQWEAGTRRALSNKNVSIHRETTACQVEPDGRAQPTSQGQTPYEYMASSSGTRKRRNTTTRGTCCWSCSRCQDPAQRYSGVYTIGS